MLAEPVRLSNASPGSSFPLIYVIEGSRPEPKHIVSKLFSRAKQAIPRTMNVNMGLC